MIRLFLLAALFAALVVPAHAACSGGGLIDTCLDGGGYAETASEAEKYRRLDGGSFGGPSGGTAQGTVIAVGDTTVTLGQTEEAGKEPWQPFNREFGDYDSLAREDRPREPGDPLKAQCYADGCY